MSSLTITEDRLSQLAKSPSKTEEDLLETIKKHIRPAIEEYKQYLPQEIKKYWDSINIYLQGSYANNTNIREDSDIDIVLELENIFTYDDSLLSFEDKQLRRDYYSRVEYDFSDYKQHVHEALNNYFTARNIKIKKRDKCISVEKFLKNNTVKADIVPCFKHIKFYNWNNIPSNSKLVEGISIIDGKQKLIVSYPKLHLQSCNDKNKKTQGYFKDLIRMYKNIKSDLVEQGKLDEKAVSSYDIENILFNCPDSCFGQSYQNSLIETFSHVYSLRDTREVINCANGIDAININQALTNFIPTMHSYITK